MKSNAQIKNYVKLFSSGLILLWLFLQSPFNPLYSDYTQAEMNLVIRNFFCWLILAVFIFWLIFYADVLKLYKNMFLFMKQLDVDTIVVFLISFTLFFVLFTFAGSVNYYITDNELHALSIQRINYNISGYPPYFLYFFTVNMFAGFSKSIVQIYFSSSFVLALSIAAKYKISKLIIEDRILVNSVQHKEQKMKNLLILSAAGLILFFPIQDYFGAFKIGVYGAYYLGKITPNVWNNSTIIFLAPFSVLLFYYQYKELTSDLSISKNRIVILSVLVLVNIFIKPSFFLVYAPISSIYLLIKHKISLEYIKNMIPIILGGFVLFFMHDLIFTTSPGNSVSSSIVFCKPFEVWLLFIPKWYLPIAIVYSLALPIAYLTFYKESLKNKLFIYALLLMAFSLLISIFVNEDGPRRTHGNFMWQNVVCYYILILAITCDLVSRYLKEGLKSYKMKILAIIFFLHSVTGVWYIFKLLITKDIS